MKNLLFLAAILAGLWLTTSAVKKPSKPAPILEATITKTKSGITTTSDDGKVRLVGGRHVGRLEVNVNGAWGTVCSDNFDTKAVHAVCRQLGNDRKETRYSRLIPNTFGEGKVPPAWFNVACVGGEKQIAKCPHQNTGKCLGANVAIDCSMARLVGCKKEHEGRLEVFHNGRWGTVCNDKFTDREARIACRMLKFSTWERGYTIGNKCGPGPGNCTEVQTMYYNHDTCNILLDDVTCKGDEISLVDCDHNGWGNHNCVHDEDISINCY